ncbi:hypothetical protein LTR78_000235 [Recurvomyces mirabilis]|uniref:Uncharacterized protein n=1 Tax=Recurvomyces mirabilis TaxID=574656 RepID=A0AAE0WXI9_9PEZI|nr:hypothetical protein LTR78_000235 [Recurvomyces mirabilis]KAK5161891.1 hypothetical protein LTS14_000236 [Recurvomyces mirabilis]
MANTVLDLLRWLDARLRSSATMVVRRVPETQGLRHFDLMAETVTAAHPHETRDKSADLQTDLVSFTLSGSYDPNIPILIDAEDHCRFVTHNKATRLVDLLAAVFEPGCTVCLHLPNDVLYPVLVLGILAARAQWTGTNPAYTAPELEHHFRVSKTKYVITIAECLETVRIAVRASGTDAEVIFFTDLLSDCYQHDEIRGHSPRCCHSLGASPRAIRTLCDIIEQVRKSGPAIDSSKPLPDDIAALMQTSGTTGLPKMAARTHRSMVHELAAIADDDSLKNYQVRRLFCTPIFHAFSAPEMIFNALRLGRPSYFMRRYDETFAHKISLYRITETFGPPAMLLRLINKVNDHHLLQSLRYVAYGGAPLGPELRRKFLGLFENKPRLIPVYGMTEGGWYTTLKDLENDDTGSVGRSIPGYDIRIDERAGDSMNGCRTGELLVRGPPMMQSYLGNEKATTDAFQDEWFKTGDIGYFEDGRVYLIDRIKEMIKVNSWQVSPTEVQNALLESDAVAEAAVFGIGYGVEEHPVACVVPRGTSSADELKAHLRTRLTGYKVNHTEIRFVKDIPKNSAGKIQKQILREQVLRDIKS